MGCHKEAWEQLCLNEAKKVGIEMQITVGEGRREMEDRSLIGKVCTDRGIGREVVRSTMLKIWRVENQCLQGNPT